MSINPYKIRSNVGLIDDATAARYGFERASAEEFLAFHLKQVLSEPAPPAASGNHGAAEINSCGGCGAVIVRWLGIRWYGKPWPKRLRISWRGFSVEKSPDCGCIVKLKAMGRAFAYFWKA